MGEHTDYNCGYVLPFAVNLTTLVAAGRRDDELVRVRSLQFPGEAAQRSALELCPPHRGERRSWADYVFGVAWSLRSAGFDVRGLDLLVDGSVPVGSGLSSSAALECAVGLAALDLYDVEVPRAKLAHLAQRAETDYVGVPCGLMDQMAVTTCTAGHALLYDAGNDVRLQLPFAPADHCLELVVVDTRVEHRNADGGYAARRRACELAAARLDVPSLRRVTPDLLSDAIRRLDDDMLRRRVRHVVTENERVLATADLLRVGSLDRIGPLLTASHTSLRDDFEVSSPELDAVVDVALASGALGARMTGGGFGGSAIALVRARDVDRVIEAVTTEFAGSGWLEPHAITASPADGVHRVR